jgi:hypothetical protein
MAEGKQRTECRHYRCLPEVSTMKNKLELQEKCPAVHPARIGVCKKLARHTGTHHFFLRGCGYSWSDTANDQHAEWFDYQTEESCLKLIDTFLSYWLARRCD